MEERLLLYRVGVGGHGLPEHQRDELAVAVLADVADAGPAGPDKTTMGAGDAANGAIGLRHCQYGGRGRVGGRILDWGERSHWTSPRGSCSSRAGVRQRAERPEVPAPPRGAHPKGRRAQDKHGWPIPVPAHPQRMRHSTLASRRRERSLLGKQ